MQKKYHYIILSITLITSASGAISPKSVSSVNNALPRKFNDKNKVAYDYAPCFIRDGSISRAYWLGLNPLYDGSEFHDTYGHSGDSVMYATSSTGGNQPGKNGISTASWNIASTPLLTGSAIAGRFDKHHAGDPAVVKNESSYYMFYGGSETGGASGTGFNRVGYAKGSASSFTRQESGKHLIDYSGPKLWGTAYGSGQPTVVKSDDGKWYMSFTTVRRTSSNSNLHAGVYTVRSTNPSFDSNVEEYIGGNSWETVNTTRSSGSEISVGWKSRLFTGQHNMNMVYHKPDQRFIFTWRKGDDLVLKFRNRSFAPTGIELRQKITRTTREGQAAIWSTSNGQISLRENSTDTKVSVFWPRCRDDLADRTIFHYDIHAFDMSIDLP